MVLDDEGAHVAERLGLDVVLDELPESGSAVDVGAAPLRLRASEDPEPHQATPFCLAALRAACIFSTSVFGMSVAMTPSLAHGARLRRSLPYRAPTSSPEADGSPIPGVISTAAVEIGFFFWPFTVDLTLRMAAAERFGWDMIGVADTPGNAMDPWVAATLVAEHTRRPKVAVCVTNLVTPHPAVTAAAIASLDLLSRGRAVLGVGAAHSGTKNLGVKGSSAAALAEGVTVIKQLLTGQPADYRGGTAHLPWVTHAPRVFQAASVPTSLAAAGAAADGVFINYGLDAVSLRVSAGHGARGAEVGGRAAGDLGGWQIACPDRHLGRGV